MEHSPIQLRVADLSVAINGPHPRRPNHLWDWLGEDLGQRIYLDHAYTFSLFPTEEGVRTAIYQLDINHLPMRPDSRIQFGSRNRTDAKGRERWEWFLREVDGASNGNGLRDREEGRETLKRRYRVAGRDLRARTIRAFMARTGFRMFARDLAGVSFENNDANQLRIAGERSVPNVATTTS